jgi:hypothetical protein
MRQALESLKPDQPIGRGGRIGLGLIAAVFVGFFFYTVHQEAGRYPGKGDLDVFLRAGWAAREGQSLYTVTDGHGFHYLYPPLFADLLIPLADPPPKATPAQNAFTLPYWASAAIYYWLSVGFLFAALHIIATTLERISPRGPPPVRSHAWWALRTWPMLAAFSWVGDGIGRGQATPLVLLLLSGVIWFMARNRKLIAGGVLGFVGVLKLFPLYLLIYPAWRFDKKMILGSVAGLIVAIVLPFAIMGPTAAAGAYHEFIFDRMVGEASGHGDPTVSGELHGTNSSIQAFEYIAYNTLHPNAHERSRLPPKPYFIAHIAIAGAVTLLALWMMRRRGDALSEILYFAALAQLMVPILPVSRPHYFALEILAFAPLLAAEWERRQAGLWPGWPLMTLGLVNVVIGLLVALGQRQVIDFGLTTYAALALAAMAMVAARRRTLGIEAEAKLAPIAAPA